jgi:hypothetical protein
VVHDARIEGDVPVAVGHAADADTGPERIRFDLLRTSFDHVQGTAPQRQGLKSCGIRL